MGVVPASTREQAASRKSRIGARAALAAKRGNGDRNRYLRALRQGSVVKSAFGDAALTGPAC